MKKEQVDKIRVAREKIKLDYCKKKKWNPDDLGFDEYYEICSLPEWKNPKID